MSFLKNATTLAFLALMSVSSVFGSHGFSGFVLCLGKDGHLEVEYSINGKCGTTTKVSQAAAVQDSEPESHCGTCTDVAFIALKENAARAIHGTGATQSPILVDASVQENPHPDRATVGILAQPPPLVSPHLMHLRTILLLV